MLYKSDLRNESNGEINKVNHFSSKDKIGQDETGGPLKIITTLPLIFVNTWKGISNDFLKTSVNKPLNHIYSKFALQFVFYLIYSVFIYLMFILWV